MSIPYYISLGTGDSDLSPVLLVPHFIYCQTCYVGHSLFKFRICSTLGVKRSYRFLHRKAISQITNLLLAESRRLLYVGNTQTHGFQVTGSLS